jgi:hypothetical protein
LAHSDLFASYALSQRLERAEAIASAAYIESRAKLAPAVVPEWIDVSGTYAMFDTPDSPVTQTFGLGMFGEVTASDLDRIEAFFASHAAPVHHEISPLADPSVWPLISRRAYAPFEFTSILYMDLRQPQIPEAASQNRIQVRTATAEDATMWAHTAAAGWSQFNSLTDFMQAVFSTEGVTPFIAEKEGNPIATGALNIQNGVALLAGASTIPEARQQGAQRALLAARLHYAAQAGCEIATMGAQPGSASQRNAERSGFRIAYTRTKWRLAVQ